MKQRSYKFVGFKQFFIKLDITAIPGNTISNTFKNHSQLSLGKIFVSLEFNPFLFSYKSSTQSIGEIFIDGLSYIVKLNFLAEVDWFNFSQEKKPFDIHSKRICNASGKDIGREGLIHWNPFIDVYA